MQIRLARISPAVEAGQRLAPVYAAWSLSTLSLTLLALALTLALFGIGESRVGATESEWAGQFIRIIGALGVPVLGALIVTYRADNRYGWVWCGFGLSLGVLLLTQSYAAYQSSTAHSLPASELLRLAADIAWILVVAFGALSLLLFPSGQLPSHAWRPLGWIIAGATLCFVVLAMLPKHRGFATVAGPGDDSIVWSDPSDLLITLTAATLFGAVLLSGASLLLRFRRATRPERQQIKWFAYAAALFCGSVIVTGVLGLDLPLIWGALFETVALSSLYVAVGIAILRHGLYDIDLLINRTLVWGTMTATVIGFYVLTVGYFGATLQTGNNLIVSLMVTGVVAVLFQPLRERVQRGVNRLVYGNRDDPYSIVTGLGRRLESTLAPGDVLPAIVQTIRDALDLPYVVIKTRHGQLVTVGSERDALGGPLERLPLVYGEESVGELCVAPRGPSEPLSEGDRRLLEDLARQVGVAVHAAQVTDDLKRSRQNLVMAQEEERRRIQRDLHDGLGPILASMRLRLEGCLELAQRSGSPLTQDLERLHELLGEAGGGIRQLVYDLRPPSLGQLGLIAALRQHVEQVSREAGITIEFAAPEQLTMPAAAEVTVYRIVHESLVNMQKHAGAGHALVQLSQEDSWLTLEVVDDGVGFVNDLRPPHAGTGLTSMRERAELLGGSLHIRSHPSAGTRLTVRIPVGGGHDDER